MEKEGYKEGKWGYRKEDSRQKSIVDNYTYTFTIDKSNFDGQVTSETTDVDATNTVYNPHYHEYLFASSFGIDFDKVNDLSLDSLIFLANAKAWNKDDLSDVEIVDVQYDAITEPGIYPITFSTKNGTSSTTNFFVSDEGATHFVDNYVITMNDVTLDTSDVAKLSTEKVLELTNAKAYNIVTGEEVAIEYIDTSKLSTDEGIYTIDIGVSEDVFVTNNIFVTNVHTKILVYLIIGAVIVVVLCAAIVFNKKSVFKY